MPKPLSPSFQLVAHPVTLTAAAVVAAGLAITGALWVHYGTAVFYEMILSGLAACL